MSFCFPLRIAGVFGALGVALGAFGAHGLKARVQDERRLQMWATGAQYHLIHTAVLASLSAKHRIAAYCFMAGITLFSGSLYAFGATGEKFFGRIAPVGGTCFIFGWLALAFL